MNAFYHNHTMQENVNKVQLVILSDKHAREKKGAKGHVANPAYSNLYYILDGELSIYSKDGTVLSLPKENCCLLPAGYSFDYTCNAATEYVSFHIKLCDFDGIDILKDCRKPLSYSFPPEMADSYISLVHSSDITDSLKMSQEIYNSLFTLLDKHRITLKKAEYSPQIKSALRYIDSNLSMQLSIAEIAANTYTSPSTLTRKFKRELGITVGQYVDNAVMSHAEQLLMSTRKSVLEIGETLGFCDQAYFARRFKEQYGVTPRDYRQTV